MSKSSIAATNATATATATATTAVVRDAAVGKLINEAGRAAASMVEKAKSAARGAAAQLRPSLPLTERIKEVMSVYDKDFLAAGHNVKAVFGDALLLLAAAACPVVINVVGKGNKTVETHTTAEKALDASKHALRDAARQVRAAHGVGRARVLKIANPAPAKKQTSFDTWIDMLPGYMKDPAHHAQVVAAMAAAGFIVTKAVKSRRVKGAASA